MLSPEKKAERAAYMRAWTARNAERVNARRRERYCANPENVLAAQREYNSRPDVRERMREYNAAYHAAHRNEHLAKQSAYRAANTGAVRAADKAWRTRNIEAVRTAARDRYHAAPQLTIDRNREWRRRNPDKILAKNQRRRATKRGVRVERVSPLSIYARDRGVCQLCRSPVAREAVTLDHIVPLSRGGPHVESNLQLAHRSCNSRKGARLA